MSHHQLETQQRRDATIVAAVGDALERMRQPRCLRSARFWQLAAGAQYSCQELCHLLRCGRCRAYTDRIAAALEGSPEPAAWAALCARARVAAIAWRVAQQPLAVAGDQRLTFGHDVHLSADCTKDAAGGCWLEIQHRLLPSGMPFVFSVGSSSAAVEWRRFVVLRDGSSSTAARLLVPDCYVGQVLRVGKADLEDLATLSEPTALAASFEAAVREDPAAVPHWQEWAREASCQTGLVASVGSLLERIAHGRRV
jgi:hypothetical protein